MTELASTIRMPAAVRGVLERIGRLADQQGVFAYAVGGCVRDWRLGIAKIPDLDITVEGDALGVARAVAEALGARVIVHQQFGTATVTLGRSRIDFASCRRETYARPAAYPTVSPGTLDDDLFRRDFTINAMAVAIAPGRFGAFVDPFGGARDLRAGLLRILHPRSFLDDPSRIVRGIRFLCRFRLRWDAATETAAREAIASGALGLLNAGRLQRELEHLGSEPDPAAGFREFARLLNEAT